MIALSTTIQIKHTPRDASILNQRRRRQSARQQVKQSRALRQLRLLRVVSVCHPRLPVPRPLSALSSCQSDAAERKGSRGEGCYWRSCLVNSMRQSEQQALATVAAQRSRCRCHQRRRSRRQRGQRSSKQLRRRRQVFYLFCFQSFCCCVITFCFHVRRPPFCQCVCESAPCVCVYVSIIKSTHTHTQRRGDSHG